LTEEDSAALIAADRADCDVQLAQYQRSVLLVLEDVENALVSYARSQDRDVQLQLAANYSKLAADLAGVRFEDGAAGLLDLLDARSARSKNGVFVSLRSMAINHTKYLPVGLPVWKVKTMN
jgi:outer membrane protein TolC